MLTHLQPDRTVQSLGSVTAHVVTNVVSRCDVTEGIKAQRTDEEMVASLKNRGMQHPLKLLPWMGILSFMISQGF